ECRSLLGSWILRPHALRTAEVGDSRLGRDAGACERGDVRSVSYELRRLVEIGRVHRTRSYRSVAVGLEVTACRRARDLAILSCVTAGSVGATRAGGT